MSVYQTRFLTDTLDKFVTELQSILTIEAKKTYMDELIKFASKATCYQYAALIYYCPEVYYQLSLHYSRMNNTIENMFQDNELTEDERQDYIVAFEGCKDLIYDIELPEKSFFFTYKDKEYFSIELRDNKLVETYRSDQKIETYREFSTVKDWMIEYGFDGKKVEYAINVESLDIDWPYSEQE